MNRRISNESVATSIVLLVFCLVIWAWMTAQAHGGTGSQALLTKIASAYVPRPTGLRVVSPWPVRFYKSPTLVPFLMTDYSPTNRAVTNQMMIYPTAPQGYVRAEILDWPMTNYPVRFSWNTLAQAAFYRITIANLEGTSTQFIDTPNRTQLTTTIARAYPTNIVTMAACNSNGVWSAESDPVQFKVTFSISITNN